MRTGAEANNCVRNTKSLQVAGIALFTILLLFLNVQSDGLPLAKSIPAVASYSFYPFVLHWVLLDALAAYTCQAYPKVLAREIFNVAVDACRHIDAFVGSGDFLCCRGSPLCFDGVSTPHLGNSDGVWGCSAFTGVKFLETRRVKCRVFLWDGNCLYHRSLSPFDLELSCQRTAVGHAPSPVGGWQGTPGGRIHIGCTSFHLRRCFLPIYPVQYLRLYPPS